MGFLNLRARSVWLARIRKRRRCHTTVRKQQCGLGEHCVRGKRKERRARREEQQHLCAAAAQPPKQKRLRRSLRRRHERCGQSRPQSVSKEGRRDAMQGEMPRPRPVLSSQRCTGRHAPAQTTSVPPGKLGHNDNAAYRGVGGGAARPPRISFLPTPCEDLPHTWVFHNRSRPTLNNTHTQGRALPRRLRPMRHTHTHTHTSEEQ